MKCSEYIHTYLPVCLSLIHYVDCHFCQMGPVDKIEIDNAELAGSEGERGLKMELVMIEVYIWIP